jgi:valyl-tRNA synthetase
MTLLFNPATPYISEALYQTVYKQLDNTLPETINLENWPTPDPELEDNQTEQEFDTLQQTLPLLYSARQNAQLKRRWPLAKTIIAAPKTSQKALKKLEYLLLELGNIKTAEYVDKLPDLDPKKWATATEDNIEVAVDKIRDDTLEGEGLMRDLARRIQALRKDLGFSPTDIVAAVHIAELEPRAIELLKPYLTEMESLVRTKKIHVHETRVKVNADWHEDKLDKKKIYVAVL